MPAINSPSLVYDIALSLVPGVGCHLSKQLVSYCGSAENVFTTKKGKLLQIPGVGEGVANAILGNTVLPEAHNQFTLCENNNVKILPYTHPDYPRRLKNVYDSPSLLYYKGNGDLNNDKVLGIVGTRNATAYGKAFVEKFVAELAQRHPNILLVSGLAYGIDIYAHKASMVNQLPTVGVMANGIDKIYPAVHRDIAYKMCDMGGMLTEYAFGAKADAHNFPARNRVVAGMCDAIVVVEAAAKGGALITAEIANNYNTEVFAVPGNVGSKFSEGCNILIREHKAHIYTDLVALEKVMNWDEPVGTKPKQVVKTLDLSIFSGEQLTIMQGLHELGETQMDELSWKINIPINRLASQLLSLEFEGHVKALPGKRFKTLH